MQLLKIGDDYHLEFEVTDFEHKRPTFEWFQKLGVFPGRTAAEIPIEEMNDHIQLSMSVFPSSHFQEACQIWTNIATTSVNRRLQFFNKGKKSHNAKIWAFLILKYLWGSSGIKEQDDFQWVPLAEISRNLVKCHTVGRPNKKINPSHQGYQGPDETIIPHYTTLLRILDDLVESELIERKKEIINSANKPLKQKENTFFRIAKRVYESDVTIQETNVKLKQDLQQSYDFIDDLQKRTLAIIKILEEKGVEPPSPEEIRAWVDAYNQGKIKI